MRVSIVVPVYREEANLQPLYNRLKSVTSTLSELEWEYVFVNDGSPDNSILVLRHLAKQDPRVRIIDLSRNFGKEVALTAGMHAVRADAAITLDSDLQHPPELIPRMIEAWRNGAEIVATLRLSTEKKPLLRRLGATVFYWMMDRISGIEMAPGTTDFRLFDRRVVDAFRDITERERMFRAIAEWMGFRKVTIEFEAGARENGAESYSYRKLFRLAVNGITSFSLFPLRLTGYLGLLITLSSGLLLARMLFAKFYSNPTLFTPLAIVVVIDTFLIGIVLMAIGLVALYVGIIHTEVINRPLYIVRERINFASKETLHPDAKQDRLLPV